MRDHTPPFAPPASYARPRAPRRRPSAPPIPHLPPAVERWAVGADGRGSPADGSGAGTRARAPLRYDGVVISSAHLDAAVDLLNRRFGVVAVWLFGSEARGAVRPDSDVDLGALFVRRVDPLDLLDARAEVAALLAREVDLVDLAAASPILAMQVLRRGRLLVDKDRVRSRAFIVGAPGRYEDVRRTRAGAEQALLRRLAHG